MSKVDGAAIDNCSAKGYSIKIVVPLLTYLPLGEYRIIFMEREMDEVLRSQSEMLKRSGKTGGHLTSEKLSIVFQEHLRRAKELIKKSDYSVLHIGYRDCVENSSAIARMVNEFLGGDLEVVSMTSAIDASLYRQRS